MARARSLLFALLLLTTVAPLPVAAQVTDSSTYTDPADRFSVPIPTGWIVQPSSSSVLLTDPDRAIRVYLVVVQAPTVTEGIAAAWKVVEPAFGLAIATSVEPPAQLGVEHALNVTYRTDDDARLAGAYGQQIGGTTYAVLLDGATDAFVRRQSQVAIIANGFRILSLREASLAGVTPRPLTPEMIADLEAYTTATMERFGVPGASVAVVQGGRVVYAQGFGVREQGGANPVTPDTLMMIGSTTKTMTTLLMAQLVDEGALRWDEPVVDVLPDFAVADPSVTERLTVKDLVCACTGVPRRDLELIFGNHPRTAEDVIASLRTFEFFTQPGEAFQYSNQMVAAGGYVATLAAGGEYSRLEGDYATLVQQRIFDPIGMPRTTFSFDTVRQSADVAMPHGQRLDGTYSPISLHDEEFWIGPIAPAGGAWSSANDMARYLITQLHVGVAPDGTRIVSPENLRVTWTPQVAVSSDTSYGLGWIIGRYKGLQVLEHGGNTFGYTTDFAFVPEADLGVVVLANARLSNVFNQAVRQRVLELVYDQPAEYDATVRYAEQLLEQQAQDLASRKEPLDQDAVAPFLGGYHNDVLGDVKLWQDPDGALFIRTPDWSSELRPVRGEQGRTSYVTVDPPFSGLPFRLVVEVDGTPVVLLEAPPDTYRFAPISLPADARTK